MSDFRDDIPKKGIFYRTGNNYDMEYASDVSGLKCEDESLTIQSGKDDADINVIVARFGLTGELPKDLKMPQSGDFSDLPDFQSALNMVRDAQQEFLRIPAELRARFGNDPGAYMSFVEDPANEAESVRLGFRVPAPVVPVVEPLAVRVIADPPVSK